MPTNANTFNSRVTSEALEAKFRKVFPAQGGAELVQDLFASGVIQPVVDFSTVAEGSILAPNLQTAWDFTTGHTTTSNATNTLITNAGFWQVDLNLAAFVTVSPSVEARISISDGLSTKPIWEMNAVSNASANASLVQNDKFVVFLRSGDSLTAFTSAASAVLDTWYRQIADVYGNLVNPSGFTSS